MNTTRAIVVLIVTTLLSASQAGVRSAAERLAFIRESPCPATGLRLGACPGYVVDHVHPLCAGGPDHRRNMQWQAVEEAKVKDRWERKLCRRSTAPRASRPRPLPSP
jgi:hypothetical protein